MNFNSRKKHGKKSHAFLIDLTDFFKNIIIKLPTFFKNSPLYY